MAPSSDVYPPILTPRLALAVATVESMTAVIDGDAEAFRAVTGASAPSPLLPPPLMDDALPIFRQGLEADPDIGPFWVRWIIDRARNLLVGSIGGDGPPRLGSTVLIGYAVYAAEQRKGFASEAAAALVAWLLDQPGVEGVRATIPPGHTASERVATSAGMLLFETVESPTDGPVGVWERRLARPSFEWRGGGPDDARDGQ
jgi:RimJ/RimL family protein N-acetyltransferase